MFENIPRTKKIIIIYALTVPSICLIITTWLALDVFVNVKYKSYLKPVIDKKIETIDFTKDDKCFSMGKGIWICTDESIFPKEDLKKAMDEDPTSNIKIQKL